MSECLLAFNSGRGGEVGDGEGRGGGWRGAAKWLFTSGELLRTAALQSFHVKPARRALRNLPARYEREVNKTLGHHKSLANDMSGAEIRRAERSSECRVEQGGGQPPSLSLSLTLSLPGSLAAPLCSSQVPMCKIIIKIAAQLR